MAKIYRRTKSSYWWAEYKDPSGKRTRCSIGILNKEKLKSKALLQANQLELDAWVDWAPGKLPVEKRSFEALAVAYLTTVQPGRSHRDNIKELRGYFVGSVLNDLSASDIHGYIAWRRPRNKRYPDRSVSDGTLRRELGVLSAMINYSNEHWEWQLPNPILGRRPPSSQGRVRWATHEQADKLLAQCRMLKDPTLLDFVELCLNTGMRKTELLACTLDRVDLRNSCIHLLPEHQKNQEYGAVYLNSTARKVILRRLSWIKTRYPESSWLFPSRQAGGKKRRTDIRKSFQKVCDAAGLIDFRPHDLRHTFASWLVQAGVPLLDVKVAMRHASVEQTEKYAHLNTDIASRVVEVLEKGDGGSGLSHYLSHPYFGQK